VSKKGVKKMLVEMEIRNLSNDLKVIYQETLNLMSAIVSARSKIKNLIELQNLEKNGPLNSVNQDFRSSLGIDWVD
jgi:hypothetical protein